MASDTVCPVFRFVIPGFVNGPSNRTVGHTEALPRFVRIVSDTTPGHVNGQETGHENPPNPVSTDVTTDDGVYAYLWGSVANSSTTA
jgi:hypothetical protein